MERLLDVHFECIDHNGRATERRFTGIHTFKDDARLFDMWAEQTALHQKYLLPGQRIYRVGESDQFDLISDEIAVPNVVQSTFLTGRFTKAGTFLYALFVKELTSHIYPSADSKKTWTKAGKVDEVPFMRNSFACSIQDLLNVYLGCVDCYRSRVLISGR